MIVLIMLVGSIMLINEIYQSSTEKIVNSCERGLQCEITTIVVDNEPSIDEVKSEIMIWAILLQIDSELMLRIADCESGYKWNAQNSESSAKGIYQFIDGTWAGTTSGERGLHQFDWKANIKEASILIYNGGLSHWQADSRSENCWNI